MAQSFIGQPVFSPLVSDNLDSAAINGRLQHLELSLAQQLGIVIRRRSADENVVAFGRAIEKVLCLQLSNPYVVEGDIKIKIAGSDDAIVGKDGNFLAACTVHDGG